MQEGKIRRNLRITFLYRITSFDMLFFYPFQFIILLNEGFSAKQIVALESIFWAAQVIAMIPSNAVIKKIGTNKSLKLGGWLWVIAIAIYLVPQKAYGMLIMAEIFRGIGLSIKSIGDQGFLAVSLKRNQKFDQMGKLEGNALCCYFLINSITSFLTGPIFKISNQLPMVICFVGTIISLMLTYSLEDIGFSKEERKSTRDYKNVLKDKVFCRIVFFAMFACVFLTLHESLNKNFLQEMKVSDSLYGFVLGIFSLLNALSAKLLGDLDAKYPNFKYYMIRIGIIINVMCFSLLWFLPQIVPSNMLFGSVIGIFILQNLLKQPYRVSIKKILADHAFRKYETETKSKSFLDTANTLYFLFESIGRTIFLKVTSEILGVTNTASTYLILLGIFIVPIMVGVITFPKEE